MKSWMACLIGLMFIARSACADGELKIGAVLSLTGPDAFIGASQAKTLQMQVEEINSSGGVNGQPLKLIVKDSGGDYATVKEAGQQLIGVEHVLAIIGPSSSGEAMILKPMCEQSHTILLCCASAEEIVNPVASYVFQIPPNNAKTADLLFKTMRGMDCTRVGLAADNSFDGQSGKLRLQERAATHGVKIIDVETYNRGATNFTATLIKLSSARQLDAIINWSSGTSQIAFWRDMTQLKIEMPLFQSPAFGDVALTPMTPAVSPAGSVLFPGPDLLAGNFSALPYPRKGLLTRYCASYEKLNKAPASSFGGYAWDALAVLCGSIHRAHAVDPVSVRDAIEKIKGLPGIMGVFTFSPEDHDGLDAGALQMLSLSNGVCHVCQPALK